MTCPVCHEVGTVDYSCQLTRNDEALEVNVECCMKGCSYEASIELVPDGKSELLKERT